MGCGGSGGSTATTDSDSAPAPKAASESAFSKSSPVGSFTNGAKSRHRHIVTIWAHRWKPMELPAWAAKPSIRSPIVTRTTGMSGG